MGVAFLIGTAHAASDCADLPQQVQDALAEEAHWSVVKTEDLAPEDIEWWGDRDCPGFAAVNLLGDGAVSYAVALIHKAPGFIQEKLLWLKPTSGGFEKTVLSKPIQVKKPWVTYPAKAGKYNNFLSTAADRTFVIIPHDSIAYERPEATRWQFYIYGGKLRKVLAWN